MEGAEFKFNFPIPKSNKIFSKLTFLVWVSVLIISATNSIAIKETTLTTRSETNSNPGIKNCTSSVCRGENQNQNLDQLKLQKPESKRLEGPAYGSENELSRSRIPESVPLPSPLLDMETGEMIESHQLNQIPMNLIQMEVTPSPNLDEPVTDYLQLELDEKKVHNLTKTLNTILEDYDKRIRPMFYGPAVPVGITMMVKSLASISEVDMEFKIDFYLRQFWRDPRLQFEMQPRVNVISLSHEFIHQIWQPDTFFPNEKKSYIHSATVTNEFIRLHSDGEILKSTRLTLTATCPMSLKLFPMDHQICSVDLGSYGFSKDSIQYKWKEGYDSVKMGLNSVILPQFTVLGHRQKKAWSITSTGNYSMLQVEFLFVRSLNYYLSQIYVPAALIVVISWFALYMGREAAAERMALGVTTVLTITTLLLSTNSNSPKISYVKAIDIYLGICFAYVFASLLQSASIGYLAKKIKEQEIVVETAQRKLAFKKSLALQEKKQQRMSQLQQEHHKEMLLQQQKYQQQQLLRKTSLPLPLTASVSRGQSQQSLNGKKINDLVEVDLGLDLDVDLRRNAKSKDNIIPSISLQDIDDNCVVLQKALSIKSESRSMNSNSNKKGRGRGGGLSDLDLDVEKNSVNSLRSIRNKMSSTKGNVSDTSSVGTEEDEEEGEDDVATIIYPFKKFDEETVHEGIAKNRMRMALCDVMSRILFPVGFLLFNIVYWVYYLNVSQLDNIETWRG